MEMGFTRSGGSADPPPLQELPTQQRRLLEVVAEIERATGESCSISLVARRMRIHRTTVRDHVEALHRKGWLKSERAPIVLRRPIR